MPDDYLLFTRTGLQERTIKKFRQGKMPIEAILDLHGMTVFAAEDALQEFLLMCQHEELRYVLIIHGKGTGILKNAVNNWLREYPDTLAFCSAKPKDGGSGALYLLLRRPKSSR